MSIWQYLADAVGLLIMTILGLFPSDASLGPVQLLFNGLPQTAFTALVGSIAVFGLFIDLPVLFACVGVILGWRCYWLVLRVWRILLELIPMLG